MKLKTQVGFFIGLIILSLLGIAYLGLNSQWNSSITDNRARINQLMKSTVNVVVQLEKAAQSGVINEETAKQLATSMLRENKYHASEYVYVVDSDMNFVATPLDPQLHGTSFNDFKDAQGKSIGAMVRQLVGGRTGEIIEYEWNSERDGEVVDLISVVERTPRWGWYVGTGISFKEAELRYWDVAVWLLIASIIIAICLGGILLWVGVRLARSLGGEITDVHQAVMNVSIGNLHSNLNITQVPHDSILGAMAYMQQSLRGVVAEIKAVAESLKTQITQADGRAAQLDSLTQLLSSETEMVSATVVELTASAAEVAKNASSTATYVNEAERGSRSASEKTNSATHTMQLLEQQIGSVGEKVDTLDYEVNNIEAVLSVIQSIAEQTNLLALNAAIEAARAGEQGRGFAVVADEVRQLASRTQSSTEEIREMISNLQSAAQEAKSSVAVSIGTSDTAVKNAKEVATSLEAIGTHLTEISVKSAQISSAVQEQLSAGQDTEERIVKISNSAQNAASVSEATHLSTVKTAELISDLEAQIAKFKLER